MTATLEEVSNRLFDYIIVGGGTAGLTLAARLSEDARRSVLVLESGGANINNPDVLRPAAYGSHFANPSLTRLYKTTPQKNALNLQTDWVGHSGKGLGGSSAINFLCWLKPPARDIDDIGRLGNTGWNWENFAKCLERTEGFVEPPETVKTPNGIQSASWSVGRNGPLIISFPPKIDDAERQIQQAVLNAGVPPAPLPMSGDPHGTFFAPCNYDPKSHTRTYATTAHYLPNRDRKNLTVLTDATVYRVQFQRSMKLDIIAVGVEFEFQGVLHEVKAKKEVILCAGTFQSPHILEQSGIGRQDILDKAEIPVKIALPGVGENVQEHIFVGLSYELKDKAKYDTQDLLRDPNIAKKHRELHDQGSGIHTSGIIGFTFAALDDISQNAPSIYRTMENMVQNMDPATTAPGLTEQYRINLGRFKPGNGSPGCELASFPGFLSKTKPPVAGKRYATLLSAFNHPFSRGTIHSMTNNPSEDSQYDPRYFEKDVDLAVFVEVVKFARKVAATSPFKEIITKEHCPGPEIQTDDQLAEWLKRSITSFCHTVGSCSMLPRDKGGVVDHTLKVYGTTNLRVADLSIVPLHIATPTQTLAYSIAEQAADIIKHKSTR